MSGVYIKGMPMPERCLECPFMVSRDDDDCILQSIEANASFQSWDDMRSRCPLIPVPPHGRLIDADAMENGLRLMAKYQEGDRQQGILGCCETIRLAPTIIPADKEGEA